MRYVKSAEAMQERAGDLSRLLREVHRLLDPDRIWEQGVGDFVGAIADYPRRKRRGLLLLLRNIMFLTPESTTFLHISYLHHEPPSCSARSRPS